MNEPKYFIFNETDGLYAHPEPLTVREAFVWALEFRERFAQQGYYASATKGRIPVSQLQLSLIPEEDA
jgi:hypothetical protein